MKINKLQWPVWVALCLVSFIFLMAGVTAFIGNEDQWAVFEKAGYSLSFYQLIATLEILGAAGLWLPRLRIPAAGGLIGIMIGAFVTQIIVGDYLHLFGPVFFTALLSFLISRWRQSTIV